MPCCLCALGAITTKKYPALLTAYLTGSGYTPAQISSALYKLRTEADNHSRGLYANNQAVYNLLRYGVPVKIEAGRVTETVHLINWQAPEHNDFVIAEEVTLHGNRERRPDVVLYVNGIAVGVLELKRSSVSIGDGIRQSISNQRSEFNEWFFSTVQFIFAGNNSEGLRYGAIGTEEKCFLTWKEDEADNSRFKLDKYLLKMCRKERLLELMHDFVLFDGGVKKLPRVHQYFGIKAASSTAPAAVAQRTGQCYAGGVEHLRGMQMFYAVPEDPIQGQVRAGDLLQPAGTGHHHGSNSNSRNSRNRNAKPGASMWIVKATTSGGSATCSR